MIKGTPELALFDLDHTLLDGDSNTLWLDYLAERGHVPPEARPTQAEHMASYAAERLDIEDYLNFHLGLLAGRRLSDWAPILEQFIIERILPRISFAARNAAAEHRRKGHRRRSSPRPMPSFLPPSPDFSACRSSHPAARYAMDA